MSANATVEQNAQAVLQDGESAPVQRICFVCTGNTCRSPMAAAVANAMAEQALASLLPKELQEQIEPSLKAFSRGLYAIEGQPISHNAKAALEDAGIPPVAWNDYHGHVAHTLREDEAEACDLLVGMTSGHTMELILRFPHLVERIRAFPREISDPYGGDLNAYTDCLAQIQAGVKELLQSFDGKDKNDGSAL